MLKKFFIGKIRAEGPKNRVEGLKNRVSKKILIFFLKNLTFSIEFSIENRQSGHFFPEKVGFQIHFLRAAFPLKKSTEKNKGAAGPT